MANLEGLTRRADFYRKLAYLADLEAASQLEGEILTWKELAGALGVEPNEQGNLNGIDLTNACLGLEKNLLVQQLPTKRRLMVIKSVAAALSNLVGDRRGE